MNELELDIHSVASSGFRLDIQCQLPGRGVSAIYGRSGSGKTTLLHCIAGLQHAAAGSRVRFRHETWQSVKHFTPAWRRRVGFVFQDARLFPHLCVRQNIDYAMRRRKQPGSICYDGVVEWLQLANLLERSAATLSAGQKQRVAIARALLSNPQLLLLDEPLANLDQAARQQCLYYLQRLQREIDLPMLYVSHELEEISQLADHLLIIANGQVQQQGSILELCNRLDGPLCQEEQAAAITVGNVVQHDQDFGLTHIQVEGQTLFVNQLPHACGQSMRLRIPARDVSICRQRPEGSSILNILHVTLCDIESTHNSRLLLRLALGEQYLLARITRKSAVDLQLSVGDPLFAQIKSTALQSEATEPEI